MLTQKQIDTLACVATEYGESLLTPFDSLRIHTGRLDKRGMEELFTAENPRLVIDATHPYATEVSDNICAACKCTGKKLMRLLRNESKSDGCQIFSSIDELVRWLNQQPGMIFSTLGAKEAAALTAVRDYQERVWIRILPDEAGLSACLSAGFLARHIICMQGPFSKELNAALFREAGAQILLTKESGQAGGYPEKREAARACGMTVAMLSRPREETGLTLAAILKMIEEGTV